MSSTVVNTPGYYYAISYWLSAFVMVIVEGRGKKDWWKYLYSVLSFISIFLNIAAFIFIGIFIGYWVLLSC